MNFYFTYNQEILNGALGRAEQMNEIFERIEIAFDKLPEPNEDSSGFVGPLPVGPATEQNHALQLAQFLSWSQHVNANGWRLVNVGQPVDAGDAANRGWVLAQITAYLVAGADPSQLPITGLGKGSLTTYQSVRVNAAGTALEAYDTTSGIDLTPYQPGDLLRVNADKSALVGSSDRMVRTQAKQYAYSQG